jgi:hypothetical protein
MGAHAGERASGCARVFFTRSPEFSTLTRSLRCRREWVSEWERERTDQRIMGTRVNVTRFCSSAKAGRPLDHDGWLRFIGSTNWPKWRVSYSWHRPTRWPGARQCAWSMSACLAQRKGRGPAFWASSPWRTVKKVNFFSIFWFTSN